MTKLKRNLIVVLAALFVCVGLTAVGSVSVALADSNYYIVYESNDYRVSSVNRLTASDGVYSISPTLSRGDKFMISDNAGKLFGSASGEPIAITEDGRIRYTVTFNPDVAFEDGSHVAYTYYSPADFSLKIGDTVYPMTYRKENAAFEEYYLTASVAAGSVVSVKGGGGEYGESVFAPDGGDLSADGIAVTVEGRYRFAFTADEDNLYEDGKYITYAEEPELYLLCAANNFTQNEAFRLERDESVIAYEQYYAVTDINEVEYEFEYTIYDADADKTYKPSESGKLTVKDKGEYKVMYSPTHVYSASLSAEYRTGLERIDEFYDGYYLLGDFNGFTFIDSEEFDAAYKFARDTSVTDYDEYALTFIVTEAMLDGDGEVEFVISDGADFIRRPNGDNAVITEAGEYEIVFSPTHNYGRGFRYKYTRVGTAPKGETVYINNAADFCALLSSCTAPENTLNSTYILTADIDLAGIELSPALIFAGELNGSFRTVKGISIKSEDEGAYLFREITSDGALSRINFELTLDGDDYTALVCRNFGVIGEVNVSGSVEGGNYVGGIAAYNGGGGKIEKSSSSAAVNGVMNAGGVAGFSAGIIESCVNSGKVNSKSFTASDASTLMNVGGICGYSSGRITACRNTANVGLNQGRYFGGVVGLSSGGVYFAENSGEIGAESNVGGIVGYFGRFSSNRDNNPLYQYLQGTEYEGWLDIYFGSENSEFEEAVDSGIHEVYYCVNSGSVNAENYAGGVIGYANSDGLIIVGGFSKGEIFAHTSYAGGIVASLAVGTARDCMTFGSVRSNSSYAGGIAGLSSGNVEYCQSSALVSSPDYAGGICGSGSTVRSCVSFAYIAERTTRFGMIAGSATTYSNNFYLEDAAGGIDGVSYGSESDYGALPLSEGDIISEGMLSPKLYGLSAEHFLAGVSEARYPVPRVFTDMEIPEQYTDEANFKAFFEAAKLSDITDDGGKPAITVAFYEYNFSSEKYELLETFRIKRGEGVTPPEVPAEDGYFTGWDTADFSAFLTNTEIKMTHEKIVTTIAYGGTEKAPDILVEGMFHADTVLTLAFNGSIITPVFTRGGNAVSYGNVVVKYRLNNPEKYNIVLIKGDETSIAQFTVSGKYAVFTLPEDYAFAAQLVNPRDAVWQIVVAAVGGALGACLIFAIVLLAIRANRKKKAAKSAANEPQEGVTLIENSDEKSLADARLKGEDCAIEDEDISEKSEAVSPDKPQE